MRYFKCVAKRFSSLYQLGFVIVRVYLIVIHKVTKSVKGTVSIIGLIISKPRKKKTSEMHVQELTDITELVLLKWLLKYLQSNTNLWQYTFGSVPFSNSPHIHSWYD